MDDMEKEAVDRAMGCIEPALMFRDDQTIMQFVRLAISNAYISGRADQAKIMRQEAERSVRI